VSVVDVVYAKGPALVTTPDGGRWSVVGGQHWPADDPVVLARPDLFTRDPRFGLSYSAAPTAMADPPVEDATAEPGARRRVAVPRQGDA